MGPAALDGQATTASRAASRRRHGGRRALHRQGGDCAVPVPVRPLQRTDARLRVRGEPGEWPYEDCQLDFDSTHLSNQVTVTQEAGGQNFYAQATSNTNYFQRTMTRTINSSSALECQDAANYLLSRQQTPPPASPRSNSTEREPRPVARLSGAGTRHPSARDAAATRRPGNTDRVFRREPQLGFRRRRRGVPDISEPGRSHPLRRLRPGTPP